MLLLLAGAPSLHQWLEHGHHHETACTATGAEQHFHEVTAEELPCFLCNVQFSEEYAEATFRFVLEPHQLPAVPRRFALRTFLDHPRPWAQPARGPPAPSFC